jgi:hypothetical protein
MNRPIPRYIWCEVLSALFLAKSRQEIKGDDKPGDRQVRFWVAAQGQLPQDVSVNQ